MIFFAVTGQAEEFIARGNISAAHACHYREWVARFRRNAKRIGYIEGDLFHLWHGDPRNAGTSLAEKS